MKPNFITLFFISFLFLEGIIYRDYKMFDEAKFLRDLDQK